MNLTAKARARRKYSYSSEESSEQSSDDDDEEEGGRQSPLQIALRDKEEALVQSALARIRRAQEKGKREVKLDREEIEALKRRRKKMQSAAEGKSKKGSGSSASGSERKHRERQVVPIAPLLEGQSGQKGKSRRSYEALASHPASITPGPPGIFVPGPDSHTYAATALGYYTPSRGSPARNSPARSRSSTQQSRATPPPQFAYPHLQASRFAENMPRPTSSSSNSSHRPLPDEESWMPGHSRRSSVSSQNYAFDPFDYQTSGPPIPQRYVPSPSSSRRNGAVPQDVAYSNLRRNTPIALAGAYSSPTPRALPPSPTSGRTRDKEADSNSSEEEDESDDLGNGVQVFVEPEPRKVAAPSPAKKSKSGTKKRNKGR
ncbi:hypothetical protein B7463_g4970, partial [Scytalidium lignicola]